VFSIETCRWPLNVETERGQAALHVAALAAVEAKLGLR